MYTRINRVWRVRERERGRRGKEEKRVWEGRKKVSSKRWKSLFVGGRRSAHLAGKWNVARGAILPSTIFPTNSLEYAATTRLVFKWYSAVPPTTLPSLSRSGRRRKREKQTYKTLDEFLIVVVQSLRVISRKGWQVRAYRIFQRELNFIGASTPNARIDQAL